MYDLIVFLVTFTIVSLWMLENHIRNKAPYKAAVKMPGPRMYPIFGNIFEVLFMNGEQTFNYIRKTARDFGESGRFFLLGTVFYNAIRAKDLEILLSSPKHIKKADIYKFIHPLMGTGLLTSSGQKWFHRRKILTPAFHFNILQDYQLIFREESHKMVETLKSKEHKNETDLMKIIPRFTLNTICETAMGIKLDSLAQGQGDIYRQNIIKMGEWLLFRAVNAFLHLDFFYKWSGLSYVFNKYCDNVHKFSWSVISQRRELFLKQQQQQQVINPNQQNGNGNKINDGRPIDDDEDQSVYGKKKRCAMLDTLFIAEANTGAINELGIREEVDTFMFEGYDTTSTALVFIFFMLAHHKNWQDLAREELCQVLGDRNENELTIQDYNEMKVLIRIIKETLRLYPPVAFMGREVSDHIEMNNVILPLGTQIYIHVFDLHRDPNQFPDPEKFDPDRFLPDAAKNIHPLAYIPFSAGPRNCIGQKFAMLEMQTLVTNILLNYELSSITKVNELAFVCDLVLRPKYPILIKFTARE